MSARASGLQPTLRGLDGAGLPAAATQGDVRRELSSAAETICGIHERLGGTVRIVRTGDRVRWTVDGVQMTPLDASIEMARVRDAPRAA